MKEWCSCYCQQHARAVHCMVKETESTLACAQVEQGRGIGQPVYTQPGGDCDWVMCMAVIGLCVCGYDWMMCLWL